MKKNKRKLTGFFENVREDRLNTAVNSCYFVNPDNSVHYAADKIIDLVYRANITEDDNGIRLPDYTYFDFSELPVVVYCGVVPEIIASAPFYETILCLLEKLRQNNFDINYIGASGFSVLSIAMVSHDINVIKILLENGANINIKDRYNGYTPLHILFSSFYTKKIPDIQLMELVKYYGADFDACCDDGNIQNNLFLDSEDVFYGKVDNYNDRLLEVTGWLYANQTFSDPNMRWEEVVSWLNEEEIKKLNEYVDRFSLLNNQYKTMPYLKK